MAHEARNEKEYPQTPSKVSSTCRAFGNATKKCVNVLYYVTRIITKGLFNTSTIVGYSQFMVFVVLRLIICGSLFGGLFSGDIKDIRCALSSDLAGNSSRSASDVISIAANSSDTKRECLRYFYNFFCPLHFWALALLSAFVPWLFLLPWTPFYTDQEYVACPLLRVKWPCLTNYMSSFLRSFVRLTLEIVFTILSPLIYGWGIPQQSFCYDGEVFCAIKLNNEKSYVIWIHFCINIVSALLTIVEIVDMCRNPTKYSNEKLRCSQLSTAISCTQAKPKRRIANTRMEKNGKFSQRHQRKIQEKAPDEIVALINIPTPPSYANDNHSQYSDWRVNNDDQQKTLNEHL